MCPRVFTFQNIVSPASREACIKRLQRFQIPIKYKNETISLPTAAVLVPLCCVNNSTSLLYTVRSVNLKNHSGQISFPGGKTDNEETPVQTALRETEEEIGLPKHKIDIWTCAPSFLGRNNKMLITPVLGSILDLKLKDLSLNQNEVAEVFTITLDNLCDPKNHFHTQFQNGFILPVFVVNNYRIWGITAFITHVILSCLVPKEVYSNNWYKKKVQIIE